MLRLGGFLAMAGLAGCLEANVPEVVTGDWGGLHLGLVANPSGATLEYDCATGNIAEPIRPDAAGRFTVSGEHFPGHGGPSLVDEVPVRRPARYTGSLRATTMTLSVTLTDTQEELGSFVLRLGESPHVFKCL